jgi:hypothetical protein
MYHSFLVRIWREAGQESGDYHVAAESVQSGQTYRFEDLTSLLDFLQAHIDSDNQTEPGQELGD